MAQTDSGTLAGFFPNRSGSFKQISDAALNDSDKTLTVPAGKVWEVLHVYATLVTTATAGNRQMELILGDGTNEIGRSDASATQAANATEYYHWDHHFEIPTETVATEHYMPIPGQKWLPPGYTIRVYDTAAVAAAADDLTIRVMVIEYDA